MKTHEQALARGLRERGSSVGDIARRLAVSRSSVSRWVRDVELGPEQTQALNERIRLGPAVAAERKAAAAREVRRGYQDNGRRLVRERSGDYAAGCMLYWAEGSKQRNSLKLTNSDPELLVTFLRFLREHFEVADDDVSIYCNLFADHRDQQRDIEAFWLMRIELPPTCLRKSTVNVYSRDSQRKRLNKLPYGTCALVVHSTRLVQTVYGSIQEYGGFDRPDWLD